MLDAQIIGEFEKQYLSLNAGSAEEVSQWVSRRHKGFRSSPLEKSRPGPVARFSRTEIDELSFVYFRWNQAFQSEVLEDLDACFVCVPHNHSGAMENGARSHAMQAPT